MRKSFIAILVLSAALSPAITVAQSLETQAREFQSRLLKSTARQETRPTMDPSLYSDPETRQAYKVAKEIPQVLDKLFCYCYCEILPMFGEKERHKSLLTCFTNNHGSKCLTCVKEANEAKRLHDEGKKTEEIVNILADKYLAKAPR